MSLAADSPSASVPTAGCASTHQLVNSGAPSLASMVKSSNNNEFRVKPVYGFVQPGAASPMEITRLPGAPKEDKYVIQFAEVADDATDAQAQQDTTADNDADTDADSDADNNADSDQDNDADSDQDNDADSDDDGDDDSDDDRDDDYSTEASEGEEDVEIEVYRPYIKERLGTKTEFYEILDDIDDEEDTNE
ncbi:hypothetical protein L596_020240 [Steinernema carpocapsae]|uniref:Major sperm protein n=1 Tax=Steinernema carpocapsae TaxID=34508 RepID=A0A4U5MSY2_STECR|nr:hypothetical protein L596_020240 [Steinernema carpocapsae]